MRSLRLGRAVGTVGVALALALTAAAPASATETTEITLNEGQLNKSAGEFTASCDQVPGGAQPGKDGWVFVLPGNSGEFYALGLAFLTPEGEVEGVAIPGDSYPSGFATNGSDKAYVVLPAGWVILGGTADVIGTDKTFFNVTHTCVGGPADQPDQPDSPDQPDQPDSPEQPDQPDSPEQPDSPAAGGGPDSPAATTTSSSPAASSGTLPVTGAQVGGMVVVSLGLIAGGAVLLLLRRRRERVTFEA